MKRRTFLTGLAAAAVAPALPAPSGREVIQTLGGRVYPGRFLVQYCAQDADATIRLQRLIASYTMGKEAFAQLGPTYDEWVEVVNHPIDSQLHEAPDWTTSRASNHGDTRCNSTHSTNS